MCKNIKQRENMQKQEIKTKACENIFKVVKTKQNRGVPRVLDHE